MADDTVTLDDLLGSPVNARDAITTALVQPETLAALLAAMDAQESPPETADPLATAFLDAVDKYFRKKIGPLPWVHDTLAGTVLSVQARTCTMRVAGLPQPVTGVLFGPHKPTVGDRYPVRFPVTLPPKGTLLAKGPVPFGPPWIKVQGGETWLYYRAWDSALNTWALYRAPLPPVDDPSFVYTNDMVLRVHSLPTGTLTGNWTLAGATYPGAQLWAEESGWERFGNPEDAPATYPYPTILHRYPNYGQDQTVLAPLPTSNPHVHAVGTNLGNPDGDYLLGTSVYSTPVASPDGNPALATRHKQFDLAWSRGGAAWPVAFAGFYERKSIYTHSAGGGYVAGTYFMDALLETTGWVATDALPGWAADGQRVSVWLVKHPDPNPYPTTLSPVDGSGQAQYTLEVQTAYPYRALLYVAAADGGASLRTFPGQPPGWVEHVRLRSTGGKGLRAWWLGHATQSAVGTVETGYHIVSSPTQLWRGTGDVGASTWDWAVQDGGHGFNALVAVNQDASVVLSGHVEFVHFVTTLHISQDAGETWRAVPTLPHTELIDGQPRGAWLVDTP